MLGASVFDLDGGRPCLDFANTLSATSGEHLFSNADLLAFADQSGLLTRDDLEWLRAEGERDPARAEAVLVRAHRLRAAIYAIFSAIAAGERARQDDLDLLNLELAGALRHAGVVPNGNDDERGYRWGWGAPDIDAPLWSICRSAAELLTSNEDNRRVRECGGEDCRWLFLDTSKNRSRQWCSMQSCGNRHKARRHYQRRRALRPGLAED